MNGYRRQAVRGSCNVRFGQNIYAAAGTSKPVASNTDRKWDNASIRVSWRRERAVAGQDCMRWIDHRALVSCGWQDALRRARTTPRGQRQNVDAPQQATIADQRSFVGELTVAVSA